MAEVIKKGKQNRSGQTARRQTIIDYIRTNSQDKEFGIKSGEICTALGLSRSSLSDDIRAINRNGEILISPKSGYYKVNPELSKAVVRSEIDRQTLRQWVILAILSEASSNDSGLEFGDVFDSVEEMGFGCSESTLHSDLRYLNETGYVARYTQDGRSFYYSDVLFSTDNQGIRQYIQSKEHKSGNARTFFESSESLEKKLMPVLPDGFSLEQSDNICSVGKKNLLSSAQLKALETLERLPYRHYRLKIVYKTRKGIEQTSIFSVGMIVYSVETNRIYLLGKDDQFKTIPLDSIIFEKTDVAMDGSKYNYLYNQREVQDIYIKSLNVSTEQPLDVKVRFRNLPYVREKVERLRKARNTTAHISVAEDQKEFLYTDTIRGLGDFARYIRRFGRAALVEEPEDLKNMMIYTCEKLVALYEEEEQ